MDLPGADLVEQGVQDLAAGRESVEALLVSIGAPRLAAPGLELPLIRTLVSYERAAECAS